MSDEQKQPEKKKRVLTESERVARVFVSQGRASRLAKHVPKKYHARLSALCDQYGTVLPAVATEFPKILRELIDEQKAAVDGLEGER